MEKQRSLSPLSKRQGARIVLSGRTYLDFGSNDYLGLSQNQEILALCNKTTHTHFGATGSRLLSGDYEIFHELEQAIANHVGKTSALFFNSGYHANTGLFPVIARPRDIVFADKYCHASIIDGVRLSGAKLVRYQHQDYAHLEHLLKRYRHDFNNAILVSESVFSMDGDKADIPTLITLKNVFDAKLVVDEAHAFGVFGENGEGLCRPFSNSIDFIIATFGKACGSAGAFIACCTENRKILVNTCRSLLFSTALPPLIAHWNRHSLALLPTLTEKRLALQERASTFRSRLKTLGCHVLGQSHIVPIVFPTVTATMNCAAHLKKKGVWAPAIRTPTVPKNASRIRFSLTSLHTDSDLNMVYDAFSTLV